MIISHIRSSTCNLDLNFLQNTINTSSINDSLAFSSASFLTASTISEQASHGRLLATSDIELFLNDTKYTVWNWHIKSKAKESKTAEETILRAAQLQLQNSHAQKNLGDLIFYDHDFNNKTVALGFNSLHELLHTASFVHELQG